MVQNATVYFLFISGFLFHYLYKPGESAASFYLKKLKRLVLPYLVASLVGFSIWAALQKRLPDAGYIAYSLITGTGGVNVGHWYIPTIILIFSTYPFLAFLIERRNLLTVLAGAGIAVTLCTFRSVGNANPLLNTLHFYGVFLLGMAVSAWWDSLSVFIRKHFWPVVIAGTLAFIGTLWLIPYSFKLEMETVIRSGGWMPDWSTLARLVMIVPLLGVLMRLDEAGWKLAPLSRIGQMSFGIFFYHGFLILIANSAWANRFFPQNNLFVFALNAVFVLGTLYALLSLAKKAIGKNSVYVFGY